jgi:hypothetical protein
VEQVQTWRCRLRRTFFGLGSEYGEVIYEEIFLLKYHGGWSFIEAYNLPTGLRRWFIKRLSRQFEEEKKQIEDARKS